MTGASKPHSEQVIVRDFPRDRDPFLRAVVEELRVENLRWPGLWTRLESLLNERDRLVEQLEAAREALAHASRPGPYCKGGSLICEICVGSCGVEEYDELVESVTSRG